MAETKTYKSWEAMQARCKNPKNIGYANYGGSGITVDERWSDFSAFYEDMGDRPVGMTLDRIDPSKSYCLDNCRWATSKQQNRNRRDNRTFLFEGKERTVPEIAELVGLKADTLRRRLVKAGEPIEIAVRPVKACWP